MPGSESKPTLIGLSVDEIGATLEGYGQPAYRAGQIYKWLHHLKANAFEEMTNLPASFRGELARDFGLHSLSLARLQESRDGTRKYLWRLTDGHHIESVFIPEARRVTLCISSQVGCSLGCEFCATARMGFLRNLTSGEIVEQVVRISTETGRRITNVVFMGMGEPFLNYNRVISACRILNDPEGCAISARRITISTVGVVPRIRQYADEGHPFSLAISLHAADNDQRASYMPIADRFPLAELMESAAHYTRRSGRRITFEYVLLAGVNDRPGDAAALIRLLSPLKCKLNLIPYNETGDRFHLPDRSRRQAFVDALQRAPFAVMLRRNRGNDIDAACGQLVFSDTQADHGRRMKHANPPA